MCTCVARASKRVESFPITNLQPLGRMHPCNRRTRPPTCCISRQRINGYNNNGIATHAPHTLHPLQCRYKCVCFVLTSSSRAYFIATCYSYRARLVAVMDWNARSHASGADVAHRLTCATLSACCRRRPSTLSLCVTPSHATKQARLATPNQQRSNDQTNNAREQCT